MNPTKTLRTTLNNQKTKLKVGVGTKHKYKVVIIRKTWCIRLFFLLTSEKTRVLVYGGWWQAIMGGPNFNSKTLRSKGPDSYFLLSDHNN